LITLEEILLKSNSSLGGGLVVVVVVVVVAAVLLTTLRSLTSLHRGDRSHITQLAQTVRLWPLHSILSRKMCK
jgi:hypothetical protein